MVLTILQMVTHTSYLYFILVRRLHCIYLETIECVDLLTMDNNLLTGFSYPHKQTEMTNQSITNQRRKSLHVKIYQQGGHENAQKGDASNWLAWGFFWIV